MCEAGLSKQASARLRVYLCMNMNTLSTLFRIFLAILLCCKRVPSIGNQVC